MCVFLPLSFTNHIQLLFLPGLHHEPFDYKRWTSKPCLNLPLGVLNLAYFWRPILINFSADLPVFCTKPVINDLRFNYSSCVTFTCYVYTI